MAKNSPRYLALLRGVNVGGKNIIAKDDLRECFEDLGYTNVRTYIQSGNILFGSDFYSTRATMLPDKVHRPARCPRLALSLCVVFTAVALSPAAEPRFTREMDLIYHKQDGFALTMEKVTPAENANGAAVILVMSGGWFSNHDFTNPHDATRLPNFAKPNAEKLLDRGYTLFYVVHGTQPKFNVREIHDQISAAVRHIRHHATEYKIDADRIGIMGASAGGHLSLMQGTKGERGEANPDEPSEQSSKVQAVVAYFPPTDFVNYGDTGVFFDEVVRTVTPGGKNPYLQALDFVEYDAENIRLVKVTDEARLAEHYQEIGPLYHVTPDDAPTLLLHGDVDKLVPLQQSELIIAKFKEVGVPHMLFVHEGGGHGWQPNPDESTMIADWFDDYLAAARE